jgi:hypothetical protein
MLSNQGGANSRIGFNDADFIDECCVVTPDAEVGSTEVVMAELSGMKQIRDYFNRSEATILQLIRQDEFPARKIAGIWESDTEEIDTWRKRQIRGAAPTEAPLKMAGGRAG